MHDVIVRKKGGTFLLNKEIKSVYMMVYEINWTKTKERVRNST